MKLTVIHDNCGDPFLIRLTLFTLFGYSLKLHIFLRGDADRELHDHPWGFWTLVIAGCYFEEVPNDEAGEHIHEGAPKMHFRDTWSLAYRPAKWRHRVRLPTKETRVTMKLLGKDAFAGFKNIETPCATLVLTKPVEREWGFWRDGSFIPWRTFVAEAGRQKDC